MSSPFTTTSDASWPDALLSLLLSTETFESFLHELTLMTVAALPEGSMCGLTVAREAQVATIASSDDLTLAIDRIQYRVGEGPCLDTLAKGETHYVTDTSAEPRWPAFCPEAFAHGVRSCLSIPLPLPLLDRTRVVAGLNLYHPGSGAFEPVVQVRIRTFVDTAAGAVSLALRLSDQARLNEDLRATLASRSVIDQAIGIVMAQQRCPAREAFALLSRASQNRNLKVRDLATEIVTTVGGRAPDTDTDPGAFDAP
ncbi:GAF and ANTAR domain-containing protein [Streptosporangium sp. NPDC023615]|uniref:GAF and ANTAR domain-containing protein n=1 Tax=Streptosporangium sp. NPDC023615 TaxID=3154794 RepID=UPI00342239F7